VEARNRLGEKRRGGEDFQLAPRGIVPQTERWHAVGDDEPLGGGVAQDRGPSRHEQPVRHQGQDPPGSRLAGRSRRPQPRAAGADQVVDEEGGASGLMANEQVVGDDAGAAMLVRERCGTGRPPAASSVSRKSSARLAPPVSGETTQRSASPSL
jgi:hypothetical protein